MCLGCRSFERKESLVSQRQADVFKEGEERKCRLLLRVIGKVCVRATVSRRLVVVVFVCEKSSLSFAFLSPTSTSLPTTACSPPVRGSRNSPPCLFLPIPISSSFSGTFSTEVRGGCWLLLFLSCLSTTGQDDGRERERKVYTLFDSPFLLLLLMLLRGRVSGTSF